MFTALTRLFRRTPPEPVWLDCAALRQRLTGAPPPLVVDVRGPDEFDGPLGHIDGARNIPLPELAAHHVDIAAERRPVVLVCLTDRRSAAAASQLAAAGIRDITVLRGGMTAWRQTR